jgi:hydroxyacylglutathione hydrolase
MDEAQPVRPANTLNIVAMNQGHRELTPTVPTIQPLTLERVQKLMAEGHALIDTRSSEAFGAGHIPDSYHVKQSSSEFEQRVGWVVPDNTPLVLLTETPEDAQAAIYKMAFIALDRFAVGYLKGGIGAWVEAGHALEVTPQIDVHALANRLSANGLRTLDVRESDEWDGGHIEGAHFMPYTSMAPQLDVPAQIDKLELATDDSIAVVCGAGNRSSTAISLLLRYGYTELYNVTGGMTAWEDTSLPMVDGQGKACNI